ncbi:MAG: glycine cleavage system protein H [Planctomycetota bacterium]
MSYSTFAMGEHDASFPNDRQYCKNHMWAMPSPTQTSLWRFGLTAYAVRLLQDVYFLDWEFDVPHSVADRQMIGSIESKKAESDLFAPIAGQMVTINDEVLAEPSLINAATYDDGWMFEIQPDEEPRLLEIEGYLHHLERAWKVAQSTIKGQANI